MPKTFPWDSYSDQPHVLKKEDKKALRKGHAFDYLKLISTNLIYFPYLFIKFLLKHSESEALTPNKTRLKPSVPSSQNFYGLCVNLDKGEEQFKLVDELNVKSLQIRVFLKDINNLNDYVEFAKGFGEDKEILITIIQDREHIENHELLTNDITTIFEKFKDVAHEFQIGNAINRIKWSFVSIEEYLKFYETVQKVRDEQFPNIKLIGSAVIDFEYHFSIRTLFNRYKIHYDKFSTLLYVDRRGSPYSTQMGIFDFKNKIEFLDTLVKSSSKSENAIYITEANWPLSGTAPYAPTSEKECVSEEVYAQYMKEYFDIALKTRKVEKIFWHQLIAAGYGLVDNREGKIRKTEAFYAFKELIFENQILSDKNSLLTFKL
ncbi:MAG: FIG00388565: hypothetical protein [uncultured Sulfurovum sp.]|uniref:Glycosyl hydrolase n=1 Tax=uncultured Sulfurovum sp. TaxID=269237 RepID=A0A6S6TIR5_9BACT|nr:MAG: FIG00388565: hypothetical protein [uncultured Sulfurovum sp.]